MSDENDIPQIYLTIQGQEGSAQVDVYLDAQEMTVWGTFHPAKALQGKLLTYSDLIESLINAGITRGFQERALQEAIFYCNTEKRLIEHMVIAKGQSPKGMRPAFLKLEAPLYNHHFEQDTSVTVDFKTFSPFIIVKKGELLARAIKPHEGTPGWTVTGKEIPAGKKDIKVLRPGPQTLFVHGKVFARCAGRFILEGDVFDVSDTLEIKGGVDYSTGHVIFPGNINVSGVVKDGFKLVSGGNITVKGPLDASEVLCKKDLTCSGGIIGKKPGLVRVGGKVESLYLENVKLEALGNVVVHRSLLQCQILTNGKLELEEGGRVITSNISSKGPAKLHQLGNEAGPCHIKIGEDFVVARKLEMIKQKHQEDQLRLDSLRGRMKDSQPEGFTALEKELEERLENLVKEMNQLQQILHSAENPSLVVTGDIYPGCTIEMGFAKLPITAKLNAIIFKLSDDKKTILHEKI